MKHLCKLSAKEFIISPDDELFYARLGVPLPTLCPQERMRRRMMFRNERALYRRNCDSSGAPIISMFSPDKALKVFSLPVWWSDSWDGKDYGRPFDFGKTLAENLKPLVQHVPWPALGNDFSSMQNSDYCNQVGNLKDCYLVYNSDFSERCMYSKGVNRCFDCLDCFKVYDSEGLYECTNCNTCTFSSYLSDSQNCTECHYGSNLIGCQHCFGCVNLRNQQFTFFNERCTPEQYHSRAQEIRQAFGPEAVLKSYQDFKEQHFAKWMRERNTENCTGDYIVNCKNCVDCYDCEDLEKSNYCCDLKKGNDISHSNYDCSFFGMGVIECYECVTVGYNANRALFSMDAWGGSEIAYSLNCVNGCSDVFACVNLRKASYCILNQQYTKDDYFTLKAKIIQHLKETKEWGEFLAVSLSPFAYNESMAQEYFPMTKEQALARGYKWRDPDAAEYRPSTVNIPRAIADVPEQFTQELLSCAATGKNYKIQKAELAFYKKFGLPIPAFCPDERHRRRFLSRNPRVLYQRLCSHCGSMIETTHAPDRAEPVLCEKDYLAEVGGST